AQGLANTGCENYGGPVVTAGGLVFIGATNYDNKFRAFDKATGELVSETTLPAAGNATPASYEVGGRQVIVIATARRTPHPQAPRERTSWSAVGPGTPLAPRTCTVTNERSFPSAARRVRSGPSSRRAGPPAVFTSPVAVTCPPVRATARSVPGAYATRHIKWL